MTNLTQAVAEIGDALDARDLPTARAVFDRAVQGRKETLDELVQRLAKDVTIPAGAIVTGYGIDVWNNPWRYDFAWRCGDCRSNGSNYETEDAARAAAEEHAAEHGEKGGVAPKVGTFTEIYETA
jgi:hypothetical protein